MNRFLRILVGPVLFLLLPLSGFAQPGSDPAVTGRNLLPNPVAAVGAPFSMTFTIGNNGAVQITGEGSTPVNKMGFSICLNKCKLATANPLDALSGELLSHFDISINSSTGCIDGLQKSQPISPFTTFDLVIAAVVTEASSNTAINSIGASCNIAPNPSANPQPTDNDFASIYTHTISNELPVSLADFSVQIQADKSVLVSWQTSWEQANGEFIVERSRDLVHYEPVGTVSDVAGTSNSLHAYRFVDATPYRGRSYYRLVQTDQSGISQRFPAKWVELDAHYGVYPNPVVSGAGFTLELDEPQTAAIRLYDVQRVEQGLIRQVSGETSVQLKPANPLPSGIYLLQVHERGTNRNHRLVVP